MSELARRSAVALADSQRRAILARNLGLLARWRAAGLPSAEAYQELRAKATAIRQQHLAHLPELLARLEAQATAAGVVVHRAEDAAAARTAITQLVRQLSTSPVQGRRPQPCRVVRVGNLLGAEIGLDAALQAADAQVTHLPLGDYILQMAEEEGTHPLFPAIHVRKEMVAQLFRERLDLPETLDVQAMASMARYHLRRSLSQVDLAISEAALAVAETGTLALATADGSERLAVSLAPVHVVLMAIADVVRSLDELFLLLRAKAISGLGRPAMPSVTLLHGPALAGAAEGPLQLHLIIVDNGRSALARRGWSEVLACIRCGACTNACPVAGEVGAEVHGLGVAGPIGLVLSPLLPPSAAPTSAVGRLSRSSRPGLAAELPWASSLCAACAKVCPVGIDLPGLLARLRGEGPPTVARSPAYRLAQAWAWAALSPKRYRLLARTLATVGRALSASPGRSLAPSLHPWMRVQGWPSPTAHPFHQRWERRRRAQDQAPAHGQR